MAQFARPDADGSFSGSWKDQAEGTVNLYANLDETAASDADYVYVASPSAGAFYEVSLSNVTDPFLSTGHVVRYRQHKNSSGGRQIDVTVELREGATVRASWSHTAISDVASTVSQTLTGVQADSITNYSNLSLRFSPVVVGGGAGREYRVTWAEVEVPDAGDPPVVAGQSSESDSATAVSRRKLRAAGQPAESDSATAVVRRKALTTGQAAGSESATAVARKKSFSLGLASESDSAGSVSAPAPVVVGAAVEQGSATLVGRVKLAALTAAVEPGAGSGLIRTKSAGLAAAAESDSATSVGSKQPVAVGQAVEPGSASPLARVKAVAAAGAAESGSASVVSRLKSAAVAGTAETDSAGTWQRSKLATLSQTVSAELSQPVSTSAGPVLVGLATESALVGSITRSKLAVLVPAGELDAAEGVVVPGAAAPRPRVVGLVAISGRLGLSAAVSGRLGASVDQIGGLATVSGRLGGSAAVSGRLEVSAAIGSRLACSAAANRVSGSADYM